MAVRDRDAVRALGAAASRLREASYELERQRDELRAADGGDALTVREVAERFGVSEEVLLEFAETIGKLVGRGEIEVKDARRAAMLVVADRAWENELGPLFSSAEVRELLGGVSRQRVDELLRERRLIGLRDGGGRRRFPAFQFHDGRPMEALASAFSTVAEHADSDWTAASWCIAADDALGGVSPLQWTRERRDPERLARVASQDAARLAR